MKSKTFTFYADAGHAWLKVSQAECNAIGLSASDFSKYSYKQTLATGPHFYLEEDQDAGVFLEKYRKVFGALPKFDESYSKHSSIRKLNRL